MLKFYSILSLICILNCVNGNYNGPFLMWGVDNLKNMKMAAMEIIDDNTLRDLYTESTAVIMFLRNSSERINGEHFPDFKNIIDHTEWLYLPQHWIASDPIDYNVNAEVIHLVGPTSQQDVEISALYRDAVLNYGKGKVLGILASKWEGHKIQKRAENSDIEVTTVTASTPTDEPMHDDYTYYDAGKTILYTTSAPILKMGYNSSNEDEITYELKSHGFVTTDVNIRSQVHRLVIGFKVEDTKITLRFRFPFISGYWYLNEVEVVESGKTIVLPVVGQKIPSAVVGFSYKCSQTLTFKSGTTELILENIQVQPNMNNSLIFSDAYDCVGFTSAPIWSGIGVSFLLLFIMSIAICAILDIKPPNRFESNRSKQLTFTIQE